MKTSRSLYLDCEFNGTGGDFISLALYDPKEAKNFYEVSKWWENMSLYKEDQYGGMRNWVRENVIPVLGKKAINEPEIKAKLTDYLSQFEGEDLTIYADWPEDFIHLLRFLFIVNPNTQIPSKLVLSLKMELITTRDDCISKIPHNALEDAKALYANHMGEKGVRTN